MKTRNGFVSNSSSTSFMISVEDKTHVLEDTYEVVSFIQKNPEKEIMIIGPGMSEGHDIFVPDRDMKNFILENKSVFLSHYPGWIGLIDYSEIKDDHPLDGIPGRYYDIDSFVCPFDAKRGTIFVSLLMDYSACKNVEDLKREYL